MGEKGRSAAEGRLAVQRSRPPLPQDRFRSDERWSAMSREV